MSVVAIAAVAVVYVAFGLAALPRFREAYGELQAPLLVVLFLLGPLSFVLGDAAVDLTRRLARRRR